MRLALILFAITALACRDKEAPKPKAGAATPAAPARADAATATSAVPERPTLPTFGSAAGSATIAEQFAADPVDSMWKSRTEGDLKRAFAKMKHPPTEAECHTRLCRLTIAGSDADVEASIDELQGLRDQAQSLLLTAPVKGADGQMKMTAYLQYERTD
jgi:hypothetical protein